MFNTTTDSILSVFTKTIAKLEAHVANKVEESNRATDAINKLRAVQQDALAEVKKAENASAKLKAFFD